MTPKAGLMILEKRKSLVLAGRGAEVSEFQQQSVQHGLKRALNPITTSFVCVTLSVHVIRSLSNE